VREVRTARTALYRNPAAFSIDRPSQRLRWPSPKEYKELARSKVCGQARAHPALSDGKLYLRDEKELICLQLAE
jgi:hypothetical protein